MNETHEKTQAEIQSLYDELQAYLNSTIASPEQEHLYQKCDQLGEKLIDFRIALIGNNSILNQANIADLDTLLVEVTAARSNIQKDVSALKTVSQVASLIDKVLEKLIKIV
ncbi:MULTISPECIES: hypothetical protein [Marinomonas]|uniref:Uncharacterized protein n=1 Tax=Marinomonas arctica TaxID=383750 RepID=A0A7H1J1B1_9GAMM|nr:MULTISPECIES: hypothetical protein [Marinomonas]MCS7488608.1 hypothetical protein [Marinomonas sp. BSi20414]QNT04277.1 hypothetical protein IBG28_10990 [Marinomonas arctica]GGN39183.1 hypothetical protein GCM10011350_39690 [Marinomonas arctica]